MRNRRLLKVCGPLALALLVLVVHPSTVAAAGGVPVKTWSDTCSFPVAQQLCDFSSWITKFVPNASSAGVSAAQDFFGTFDAWVASGAAWVLDHVGQLVQSTTAVNLNATWYKVHYLQMVALSAFVMLPILIIVAMKAALVGEGGALGLAVFLYMPFTIVLTFIAIPIVNGAIGSVDWMSNVVLYNLGGSYHTFAENVATSLGGSASGAQAVSPIIGVISAILLVVFGFLIIVEMLFRNAALYVTAIFIPFALAPVVIPGLSGMAKRLFNALVVIVFIKFFIVVSIVIGVAALGAGNQCPIDGGTCSSFSTVLAGVIILINAAVLPNLLINFLPLIEGAAIATILAAGSRSVSAVAQPSSAGIYSNIRRDTELRLAMGGGPRGPRLAPRGGGGPRSFGGGGMRGRGLTGRVTGTGVGAGAGAGAGSEVGGNVRGGLFSRGSFLGRSRAGGSPRRWGLGGSLRPTRGTPRTPRS